MGELNKTQLKEKVVALEAENALLKEGADEAITAENEALKTEIDTLKGENDQFTAALADAHEAIGDAEAQVVDAPVFTVKDKKKDVKVKLIVPQSKYPKSRHEIIDVNAETLKEDQKLVQTLFDIGFGGFEIVEPETE